MTMFDKTIQNNKDKFIKNESIGENGPRLQLVHLRFKYSITLVFVPRFVGFLRCLMDV